MVFKLVRTDTDEPCKIQLQRGLHIIGRGNFLDCSDKRVSRRHGELEVTDDAVSIKALHQNPCFYLKKGSNDIQVLKLNNSAALTNGDKFGLLPDCYWYEVMVCSLDTNNDEEATQRSEGVQVETASTLIATSTSDITSTGDERVRIDFNETIVSQRSESPSLIPARPISPELTLSSHSPTYTPQVANVEEATSIKENQVFVSPELPKTAPILPTGEPESGIVKEENETRNGSSSRVNEVASETQPASSILATKNLSPPENDQNNQTQENKDSPKRCISPGGSPEVKRVKTEPLDVKQEPGSPVPQAGPSGNASTSNDGGNNTSNGIPPSPTKPAPPAPARERCIYGDRCYRKNPAHKAQFSHPSDSDWGAGERGVCPYGASCMKRDPRHWRDHDHPPGVQPPPPPHPQPQRIPAAPAQNRAPKAKRQRNDSGSEDDDSPQVNLIVTGKRKRKTVQRESYSGSEDEEKDPYGTDESDEWTPGSESYSQSQTQDF